MLGTVRTSTRPILLISCESFNLFFFVQLLFETRTVHHFQRGEQEVGPFLLTTLRGQFEKATLDDFCVRRGLCGIEDRGASTMRS